MSNVIPSAMIEERIFLFRGEKVMIDRDLAELYKVPTGRLNEQVRRNLKRFPDGFMFQLTKEERDELIANCDRFNPLKHAPTYPLAFTEHGVAMLSSVLRSDRAIQVNIQIIKTFVRLRRILSEHRDLARKLDALEKKYDTQFKVVFDAIRQLMTPTATKNKRIGF